MGLCSYTMSLIGTTVLFHKLSLYSIMSINPGLLFRIKDTQKGDRCFPNSHMSELSSDDGQSVSCLTASVRTRPLFTLIAGKKKNTLSRST